MGKVLELDRVYKAYKFGFIPKKKQVLKGISFYVNEGEIFGYLGPNGAGKTTTIKSILNLIFPDAGRITILAKTPSSHGPGRKSVFCLKIHISMISHRT